MLPLTRYLEPFEWIVGYNLGLVHLNTGQYASAFHYFSASISAKPDFAHSYMCGPHTRCLASCASRVGILTDQPTRPPSYSHLDQRMPTMDIRYLAITLSRLDDFENACAAYEKAIDMDAQSGGGDKGGAGTGAATSGSGGGKAASSSSGHLFHLNFAITLFNNDEAERAAEQFDLFERAFQKLNKEAQNADLDILAQRDALSEALAL